jgi:hypothetical protein
MKPSTLFAAFVITEAAVTSGCTVYSDPVPAAPVAEVYSPAYYNGSVVYYDEGGSPYYYSDAHEVVYVPRTYAHYDVLVGGYRSHGPAYHAWYRAHGGGRVVVRHYRR